MGIEVGQKWKTRDGGTVTITDELYCTNYHYIYPFITETGARYTRGGLFKEGETGPRDLVELLEREAPMRLEIKVGQEWLTRGGNIVTIIRTTGDDYYPFVASNDFSYKANGSIGEGVLLESYDLVELVKDVPCNPTVLGVEVDYNKISIGKAVYESHRWEYGSVSMIETAGKLTLFVEGKDPLFEISYDNLIDLKVLLNAHLT